MRPRVSTLEKDKYVSAHKCAKLESLYIINVILKSHHCAKMSIYVPTYFQTLTPMKND